MGRFFSDKVEEAVRKVWMTYDKDEIQQVFFPVAGSCC